MERVLEKDEYIQYSDKSGNHLLISNFGLREFKCTSSCYCHSKRRDPVSSFLLIAGVVTLIGAVNHFMAVQELKKERIYGCALKYNCPIEDVEADVKCEELDKNSESTFKKKGSCEMNCRGSCVPDPNDDDGSGDCSEEGIEVKNMKKEGVDGEEEEECSERSMMELFRERFLNPVCDSTGKEIDSKEAQKRRRGKKCFKGFRDQNNVFCDPLKPIIPEMRGELYPRNYGRD